MGIKSIDEGLCNGCAVCVDSCPMDVIRFDKKKEKAYPAYPGDCTTCYLCEMDCAVEAIYVSAEASRPIVLPW